MRPPALSLSQPQNEWKILLVDHHSGYISWEEYLENQRRLEGNGAWRGWLKRDPSVSSKASQP
jgi:hypothetical protein